MADEPAATPKRSSSIVRLLIMVVGAVLAAAIVALLLYKFVLAPMLSGQAEKKPEPEFPATAVWVDFDQASTTAVMPPGSNLPASLLMYTVSLCCSNQITADLVNNNKAWFVDELRELHSHHTREQLDDPMLLKNIQKQALLRCNEILDQLQGGKNPANRVLKVTHKDFLVVDQ